MSRSSVVAAALTVTAALAASAPGATWEYEATSGWTLPAPPPGSGWADDLKNWSHVRRYDMVVDPSGNVFVNAGDGRNWDTINTAGYVSSPGGATIFKPDGAGGWTQVDIDLTHTGLDIPGGITKMVVGGDGKVYALQNWHPPGNNWSWYPHWMLTDGNSTTGCNTCKIRSRILRINVDGSVDIIDEQSPPLLSSENWVNIHGGLTVGGDGHVYWWLAGAKFSAPLYWREHVLWRYNVTSQTVEESPTAGTNNGKDWMPFFHNLAYVGTSPDGTQWLVPMQGIYVYPGSWAPTAMAWNVHRKSVANDGAGDGRNDPLMEIAYDPAFNKLWTVARGKSGSCIARRYDGDPAKPSLFDNPVAEGLQTGIVTAVSWHANGNAPDVTAIPNGGDYWVTDVAINPGNGAAWMSFGAVAAYNFAGEFALVGPVYTVGRNDGGPTGDEGVPQSYHPDSSKADNASQTLALEFVGTKVYALTFDLEAREFNLFSADNPYAELGACCQPGAQCDELTEGGCAQVRGIWQGGGTTCAATDCKFQACNTPAVDADGDGDVDMTDFGVIQTCVTLVSGTTIPEYPPVNCSCYDADGDGEIGLDDLNVFILCANGSGVAPSCP